MFNFTITFIKIIVMVYKYRIECFCFTKRHEFRRALNFKRRNLKN